MTGSDIHSLEMRLRDRLVGHLNFNSASEAFSLDYSEDWQQHGFALAPKLPLDGSASSAHISAFLSNLLPENQGLEHLIEYLSVSRGNTFALIRGIGMDTTGAVSFIMPGTQMPETRFIPITESEMLKRLDEPDVWALEVWDDKPRLSVAGVQSKLNLFMRGGEYGFGEGELSSTHIIKFEKHHLKHLVLNEFLTMRLAKAAGFDVAEVEMMWIGDHRSLVVERFDRRYEHSNNRVLRRHKIDSCQALGFSVNKKYERNFGDGRDVAHIREGVSFTRLFGLAELCVNPAQARLNMLQWALYNLVTSNFDAHGKNYSFFVSRQGLSPTPWYDLVNVGMFPQFSQSMAMAFGDEFEPVDVHAYQLLEFADECGLPKRLLKQTLEKVCHSVLAGLEGLAEQVTDADKDEQRYMRRYKLKVSERCGYFLRQAEILPELEL